MINKQYPVKLTVDEQDQLKWILNDWATTPEILGTRLYADLRDRVEPVMAVTFSEAVLICGCFEADDNFCATHRKFADVKPTSRSEPITSHPVRDVTYEEAKIEIAEFIKSRTNNRVYISEIVNELHIDIDLIITVFEDLSESK